MSRVRRLAVVGLGLIGGSVARGAKARGLADEVVGVGRDPRRLEEARRAGAVDRTATELAAGLRDAELVLLATPVGSLPALVREAWALLEPGAVLTDVGSVKAPVVAAAGACPARPGRAFVGGHPLAGSERSGFSASRPDLFEGAVTILTPTGSTPPEAVARAAALWEGLGSQVRLMSADEHDRAVAAVSHLPHLVAYALVGSTGDDLPLAARGFQDTTRIAASDETLWVDIFRDNREVLLAALGGFTRLLARWEAMIRAGEWAALEAELARIRELREKLG